MINPGLSIIITKTPRVLGERKSFTLRSLKATDATQVSVLGHGGELLEYRPDIDIRPLLTVFAEERAREPR